MYVGEMVSSEANHKYTNAGKGRGLASLVDVPANPRKQRAREGKGRKKKRGRVGDVFRGATSDWNLVPHEPGGIK